MAPTKKNDRLNHVLADIGEEEDGGPACNAETSVIPAPVKASAPTATGKQVATRERLEYTDTMRLLEHLTTNQYEVEGELVDGVVEFGFKFKPEPKSKGKERETSERQSIDYPPPYGPGVRQHADEQYGKGRKKDRRSRSQSWMFS